MTRKIVCLLLSRLPLLSVLSLLSLSPTISVQAQSLIDTKLSIDTAVHMGTLSNGLTYYIRRNTRPEKKVELRLVVNAGSILEDDDQQGLAHFCEHMAFKGTKHFPKLELISYLQSIGVEFGADLNAYTGFDETVYQLSIPLDKPGNLENGFQMLEDWAHNCNYESEDIDKERGVVLEESRLGKGANDRMFRKIYPVEYAGSKYAQRLPIGKDSILETFKYETLRRFYHDWYRPDLMAVVVVGDLDPGQAETMLRNHFSGIPNPKDEKTRMIATVPARETTAAMLVTDTEATHTVVHIDYPFYAVPPIRTIRDYRDALVKDFFSDMLGERLIELSKEENPPFTYPSNEFTSLARGYEGFSMGALTVGDDAGLALAALTKELDRVMQYGFTQTELDRAKKQQLSDLERALAEKDKTESEHFTDEYVQHFLTQDPIPGIAGEYDLNKQLLPGITLEEINHVIDRIRANEHRLIVVQAPKKTGLNLPGEKDILAIVDKAEHDSLKPYVDKAVAPSLMSSRPLPGKIISRKRNGPLETWDLELSNGIKVTLRLCGYKNEEVKMLASRFGGTSVYSAKDWIDVNFATAVVGQMGMGNFSPIDLGKINTGKKAEVSPQITDTHDMITGSSSVKDLETLFQLLYLSITQPRKDEKLFNTYRQSQRAIYANLRSNPQVVFIDTIVKTIYHKSPLAPILVPKASDFDSIHLDRVMAIYKERIGDATGVHFTFVGNFNMDTILLLIQTYIASLPTTSNKMPHFADNGLRPLLGRKNLRIYKGKENKSLIILFYEGEVPYSEDLALKALVLREILNIKIIDDLREKMSDIYGGEFEGQLEKEPYGHYEFTLQLPCAPEHVDTLLKAAAAEIERIKLHGPDQKDLDKVKQTLKEKHLVSIRTYDYWVAHLDAIASGEEDPSRLLHFTDVLDAISVKDIQAAAKLLFNGKNVLTAVLYPEKK